MTRSLRICLEILPCILVAYCVGSYFLDRDYFTDTVMSKDSLTGAGVVETLTPLVLLVAIGFGVYALSRFWNVIPNIFLRIWIVLWTLGSIYFAGEEVSWGQWIFQWETPEVFTELNKQEETNLHNMSSWLNEKPRVLVELWFIGTGLILSILRLKGKCRFPVSDWREWLNPYALGISACVLFLVSKILGLGNSPLAQDLGNSELRELLIAYLITLYMLSVVVLLKSVASSAGGKHGKQRIYPRIEKAASKGGLF